MTTPTPPATSTQTSLIDLLDRPTATRSKPDAWLTDHLIAGGHLTETGLSRRARIRTCRCRHLILAGLDSDICAFEAAADPIPLTPLAEMLARIEGRPTYDLRREGGGWVLDRRDHHRIAFAPAGSRPRIDVVRAHQCHSRNLSGPETTHTAFAEARPTALPPGAPAPF